MNDRNQRPREEYSNPIPSWHTVTWQQKNKLISLKNLEDEKINKYLVTETNTEAKNINPLKPNDPYSGRTAPLTSKLSILYIYSTNTGTKYFKHGIHSLFFSLFKMQFVS